MGTRRLLKAVALFLLAAVVVPVLTAGTVLASFLFLPLPVTLPEPRKGVDAQVSRVYDIEGRQIGQFRRFEITDPVEPADIPQVLKDAVVASEDRRFYEHGGVDLRGTLRALWADLRSGEAVQGGSTITQQYVKHAYVGSDRSLSRKLREAVIASQLDRTMEKDDILFNYLNTVYLGEGAHGVGAAAQTYFRKSNLHELTLSEAATLAGLIPAPSFYEPRGNAEGAENKRKIVLGAMLEAGFITQEQHDAALPYVVHFGPDLPPGTPHTKIFRREEQRSPFPYYLDYVRRVLEFTLGPDAVYNQGLEIHTALDRRLQLAAEEEVRRTLEGTAPPIEMSLVSVEPASGWVKALVGGRDFYAPGSGQVNLALGGTFGMQTGSTFKPFVLAAALEQGISPDKRYSGRSPMTFGGGYSPKNYGNDSYGSLTLREATKRSVNTVFVQLMEDVGVQATMDFARQLGHSKAVYREGPHGLSVALGALEGTPLDMASAYGVWAARGLRAQPSPIRKVLDSEGVTLLDNSQPKTTRVMREELADTMNEILQGVFTPGGTANGRGIGRPAAGKTGTTDDNTDAWFVGYTPQLSTAVWMGHSDGSYTLSAKGISGVTGGTWPARTWQAYMRRAVEGIPVAEFNEPAPITRVVDDARTKARGGFGVGTPLRAGSVGDGGRLTDEPEPPSVAPPSTTTSTTSTTTPLTDPLTDPSTTTPTTIDF